MPFKADTEGQVLTTTRLCTSCVTIYKSLGPVNLETEVTLPAQEDNVGDNLQTANSSIIKGCFCYSCYYKGNGQYLPY